MQSLSLSQVPPLGPQTERISVAHMGEIIMLKLPPIRFQHNIETKCHVKDNVTPRLHSRLPHPASSPSGKASSPEVLSSQELRSRQGTDCLLTCWAGKLIPNLELWTPKSHTETKRGVACFGQ